MMSYRSNAQLARFLRWIFVGSLWWLLGLSTSRAVELPRPAEDPLFDGPLLHFEIELDPDQIGILRQQIRMSGQKQEAKGTVRVGTNRFTNVRLHVKGSGSFRAVDLRPSFTLHFSSDHPFFGLTKLHLNNSVHDATRLHEVLGSELHRQAGVPTARATPVRVSLNGRDLSLYVLKEGFDRRFLKRHFTDPKGNLYDPRWAQDIDEPLECDSGPGQGEVSAAPSDFGVPQLRGHTGQPGRERLLRATQLPLEQRLGELSAALDVERFLTCMALQILTDDWDGYARHSNNYRLYHDPASGRCVFFPHGMDQLFVSPGSVVYWPKFSGLVARSLFELPSVSADLRERMEGLQQSVFTETNLLAIVTRTERRVLEAQPPLSEREREFFLTQVEALRGRLHERVRTVRDGPREPLILAPGKSWVLTGWQSWAEVADTEFAERQRPDGTRVLSIQANSRATCGAWRTRLTLGAGSYRFEGRASLKGVRTFREARDPGVGLRVTPGRRGEGLFGTLEAQSMRYGFQLAAPAEVVFAAELSAHAGEVEFEAETLRVVRVGRNTEPE